MRKHIIQVSGVSLALLLLLGLVGVTLAQGTAITVGTTVQGAITELVPSAAYTFTANGGDVIQVDVQALTAPGLQPSLVLIGPNQAQLAAASPDHSLLNNNQASLIYALNGPGTYMVVVNSANGAPGEFILSLNQLQVQMMQPLLANEPAPITLDPGAPGILTDFMLDPGAQTIVTVEADPGMVYSAIITNDQGAVVARLNSGTRTAQIVLDPGLAVAYHIMLVAGGDVTGTVTVVYGRATAPLTPAAEADAPSTTDAASDTGATTPPAIVTATPAGEVAPPPADGGTIVNPADCVNAGRYLNDVTIADGMPVEPSVPFVKSWRVVNTGTCAWTPDYALFKVLGDGIIIGEDQPVPLPVVQPGQEATISVMLSLLPDVPLGERASAVFEMGDAEGFLFGPDLTVEVTANLPETSQGAVTGDCLNQSAFVADVTILDGTAVTPGQPFVKTWRILNSGSCPWTEGYKLTQLTGDLLLMDPANPPIIPPTEPGQAVELSVTLTLSPDAPAGQEQQANFRLQTPDDQYFGEEVYLKVTPLE